MKRCPECRRDYYDDTQLYCLDDGNALLEGPASGSGAGDEPATAILSEFGVPPSGGSSLEAATRAQIHTTEQTTVLPANTGDVVPRPRGFDKRMLFAPLALAVIVLGGLFAYRYITTATQINSIAVMPFVNEGGNGDIEYLSDGMTETLISSLTQLPNLNVKARSSVFRYKGKEMDTKTVGKELNVQAILIGRVSQSGNLLTLSLELVDVATENAIWSQQYSRKQSDLVTLQSEIARDVSNKLKTKLSGADVAKVEKSYTANPEAYKSYLQGRFYWNKRTGPDIIKAIEYLDQAIALDPAYALAYSGLADAYYVLPGYASDPPPDVTYPKASAAARKALEIDPTLADPHAVLGSILHEYEWNHAEAEIELKRAIELDPNSPSAHQWYGNFLSNIGRFDEGIAELNRALELAPFSLAINSNLGSAYRAAHRYDEAIAQYQKTLEIEPTFEVALEHLSDTYLLKGMYEEAIDLNQKRALFRGGQPAQVEKYAAELKQAYHKSGEKGYWQTLLEKTTESARKNNREADPFVLAVMQLGAGNNVAALDYLEKGVANGRGEIEPRWLISHPKWDPLRSEPRFKELLRKVGLPE